MQLAFFCIPARNPEVSAAELNRFCESHRIVGVEKHLINDGENSFWSICVSWLPATTPETRSPRGRIDYREVLSEQDFGWYARLRELRKAIATENGVSVFQVFTNRQLADMVTGRVVTNTRSVRESERG